MKRLRQLARTSAMRLALRYALWQVALLAVALVALFWVVNRYVDEQISTSLATELAALKSLPPAALAARVEALADTPGPARGARHYLLLDANNNRQAGSVLAWPSWLQADGVQRQGELILIEHDNDQHAATQMPVHDDLEATPVPAVGAPLASGGRLLIAQEPGAAEDLREAALIAGGVLLLLAAGLAVALGLALGWQWLHRIERVNQTAGKIAAGDFSQRVEGDGRGDEFDLLASHLNAMLERIEAAVAGMREVSDNVAHDLRRPLARLKTRIEVILHQPRAAQVYQDTLTQTLADADELMHTFDALLSIARLEAGSERIAQEPVDLAALLRDVAELYADEAEASGRTFQLDLAENLAVSGSRTLLAQALVNLLDNAFKYTAPGTALRIALARDAGHARLAVIDHGAGIATGDYAKMTERFARADSARSQPGSGLGLALVKAIAHAHRGKLTLRETPGGGLTAELALPLAGLTA